MYLSEIKITSYKSFRDSAAIKLEPNINIVIGANNSGKTALLEVLSLNYPDNPHKSLISLPTRNSGLESSCINIKLTITPEDFKRLITNNREIYFPIPSYNPEHFVREAFDRMLTENTSFQFNVFRDFNINLDQFTYGFYEESTNYLTNMFRLTLNEDLTIKQIETIQNAKQNINIFPYGFLQDFQQKIYRFRAERLNVSKCNSGSSQELKQNASNLPEVLQVLQTRNNSRYSRYINLVNSVFPNVKWVSAETHGTSEIELKVWTVDPETERNDLSVPLSECGTGIGQVLAILYVVVNSDEPRMLIIDEPQSFLHPLAAKKLIKILKDHPQHQYIISTHSSEILAVANPSTITSLEYSENNESIARSLNKDEAHELGDVLQKIGVSLGDVLYADNILWVEGETEEKAFPMILERAGLISELNRITILPLANTAGVTSKKNADMVQDIYRKLSAAHALVPPVIGIILDSETLPEAEKTRQQVASNGLLAFIPCRCYENYLLDADATAAVANNQDGFRDTSITREEIEAWLNERRGDQSVKDWLEKADGATLLSSLFNHFSEGRVHYQKTDHSIQLTEWLLENKPNNFDELVNFLRDFLHARSGT